MVLAGVGVCRKLRAFARLEDAEDNGADEGSYELRYCLVDCGHVLAGNVSTQMLQTGSRGMVGGVVAGASRFSRHLVK